MGRDSDIRLTDVAVDLDPSSAKAPFVPVVRGARLQLNDRALGKLVAAAIEQGKERAPVDVEFSSARFSDGEAQVTVRVSKGRFLKTDVQARVGVEANDAERVLVEVREVKAMGMVPIDAFIDPFLEKALAKAASRPGVAREAGRPRTLSIDPAAVLAAYGSPVRLAQPGGWTTTTEPDALEVVYAVRET